jgi:hypothetical protein
MPASAPQELRERPAQRGGAHAPPRHATAGAPRARRPEDHRPALRPRIMRVVAPPRPRVLLTTEGTYPYAVGGVSSWCDLLVKNLHEFDWQVLPIVAPHGRPPLYELPAHARQVGRIEVWSETLPMGRHLRPSERRAGAELPAVLVRGAARLERRLRRRRRRLRLVPQASRRRAPGVPLAPRLGVVPVGPAAGARRAHPGGRLAARARHGGGRAALPDALLGGAHGRRADAGHGRPARHRGRLVGRPRARPQGPARHADDPHGARRLRARGLPRRRAQRRIARQPLHRRRAWRAGSPARRTPARTSSRR